MLVCSCAKTHDKSTWEKKGVPFCLTVGVGERAAGARDVGWEPEWAHLVPGSRDREQDKAMKTQSPTHTYTPCDALPPANFYFKV